MIIAECGQNHQGDMAMAKRLVSAGKDFGADLIKFQLYDTDKLYEKGTELYRLAKEAELNYEQAKILFEYGKERDIEVFFSVFDVERVKWCEEIGVKRYKIACSQNQNETLLKVVFNTKKECLISYREESLIYPVDIYGFHIKKWMYCIPKYPTSLSDLQFDYIWGEDRLNPEGYSDHTIGLDAAKIALARGAKIIEKHFSFSHDIGVDGLWSMTPRELMELRRWMEICKEVL